MYKTMSKSIHKGPRVLLVICEKNLLCDLYMKTIKYQFKVFFFGRENVE